MKEIPNATNVEQLLGDLEGGVFAQKLAIALSDAALAVAHTGKKGSVSVSFDMKRIGETNQVEVTHKLSYSKPTAKGKVVEESASSTPLHVGGRGALTLIPQTHAMFDRERSDS